MANAVNRNLDGPPTQGRRRECQRRMRQLARQAKPPLESHVSAEMQRLVEALSALPPEVIAPMLQLDEAELGYVEDRVDTAQALAETAPAGVEPMEYARRVLAAMDEPVALNYRTRR